MKCPEVQNSLALLAQKDPVLLQEEALRLHLQQCDICRHQFSDLLLNKNLQSLVVPAPRADFVDHAIARATGLTAQPGRHKSRLALAATLFLGIALGLLFSAYFSGSSSTGPSLPGKTLPELVAHQFELIVDQTELVHVIIDSDTDVEASTISISLADNMEIEGYPNTRELSWNAELRKGKNLLKLPLKIFDTNAGYLEVAYSDGLSEHRVHVDVNGRMPAIDAMGIEASPDV